MNFKDKKKQFCQCCKFEKKLNETKLFVIIQFKTFTFFKVQIIFLNFKQAVNEKTQNKQFLNIVQILNL